MTAAADHSQFTPGTRVRLRPASGGDTMDMALSGRIAEVDRVETGVDGREYVVVALDGDWGRDFAAMSQLGHRFFFHPTELQPLLDAGEETDRPGTRVLVAGIGDEHVLDGAFGSEVIRLLRQRRSRVGVHLVDFGIRASDLAEVGSGSYEVVLVVGAYSRRDTPGTIRVEAVVPGCSVRVGEVELGTALDQIRTEKPNTRMRLIGCRTGLSAEPNADRHLSRLVRVAIPAAVAEIESLIDQMSAHETER